jgi:hypothetical protein
VDVMIAQGGRPAVKGQLKAKLPDGAELLNKQQALLYLGDIRLRAEKCRAARQKGKPLA